MDMHDHEILVHLRDWIAGFKAHEIGNCAANPIVFVEKIERVLNGENTLGIMPCIVCGTFEGHRHMIEEAVSRAPNDHREVGPSSFYSLCSAHHFQRRDVCVCGAILWVDVTEKWRWFDTAGTEINQCTGCTVRLGRGVNEQKEIAREVYAAAGFVRKGM